MGQIWRHVEMQHSIFLLCLSLEHCALFNFMQLEYQVFTADGSSLPVPAWPMPAMDNSPGNAIDFINIDQAIQRFVGLLMPESEKVQNTQSPQRIFEDHPGKNNYPTRND